MCPCAVSAIIPRMGTLNYQSPDDARRERKGLLRQWFGPCKDEVWKQLADGIGASFVDRTFWNGSKVVAKAPPWEITLDTYDVSNGETTDTHTRVRAPFVNADGFYFKVYRASLFTNLGKALGMQDVTIGFGDFDEAFVIQTNDESKARRLLAKPRLRELMMSQPRLSICVKDEEGMFRKQFPEHVDELYFDVNGIVKDIDRLEKLFELFAETLDGLCEIGSAYRNDPGVKL
jgi:hypothetical protein